MLTQQDPVPDAPDEITIEREIPTNDPMFNAVSQTTIKPMSPIEKYVEHLTGVLNQMRQAYELHHNTAEQAKGAIQGLEAAIKAAGEMLKEPDHAGEQPG